jgi:cell wall integrity and stress response component
MKAILLSITAALLAASPALAECTTGCQLPIQPAQLNTQTSAGCYSAAGDLEFNQTIRFNSKGICSGVCIGAGKLVSGLMGGNQCWCGDSYPPKLAIIPDNNCNVTCPGYGSEACTLSVPGREESLMLTLDIRRRSYQHLDRI